jgi:UDP-2,4-diacetamido-2,4,6-trideoxy-beta-L-altropyranose hydrolase
MEEIGEIMMKVLIRADSSFDIGTGHIMRCLTLANRLASYGCEIVFATRFTLLDMVNYIRTKGFVVYEIYENHSIWDVLDDATQTAKLCQELQVDWVITDHYKIDEVWEKMMRPAGPRVFVIDDLANRVHDCDLLLDQNYTSDYRSRYNYLVPQQCKLFLGPQFALIRDDFYRARREKTEANGLIKKVMVFFGGSDPNQDISKVVNVLKKEQFRQLDVTIIAGKTNPASAYIFEQCAEYKHLHVNLHIEHMADEMAKMDLFIGAGGSTSWERCILGLPSIIVSVADNQVEASTALHHLGVLRYLGSSEEVSEQMIYQSVMELLHSPELVRDLSQAAFSLMNETANGTDIIFCNMLDLYNAPN